MAEYGNRKIASYQFIVCRAEQRTEVGSAVLVVVTRESVLKRFSPNRRTFPDGQSLSKTDFRVRYEIHMDFPGGY